MHISVRQILVELVWILAALATAWCLSLPMKMFEIDFSFELTHYYFISLGITFIRWLFLWKYTPYAWFIPVKLALLGLIFFCLVIGFDMFQQFKAYLHDTGLQQMVDHLPLHEQDRLMAYIRSDLIFWGTSFLITGVLMIPKIFWSIWKQINRKEV